MMNGWLILANITILLHFTFVLFVIFGGLLVARWKRFIWIHLPALLWGAFTALTGWVCPLTPLENWFLFKGGGYLYQAGFIEHHILPFLYPEALTRGIQVALGVLLLVWNLGIYAWVHHRTPIAPRRNIPDQDEHPRP